MEVVDLAAKRWSNEDNPSKHQPQEAAHAYLRDCKSGKLSPTHTIVVAVYDDEDMGSRTVYFQSGNETVSGQMGMLARAMQMMGSL